YDMPAVRLAEIVYDKLLDMGIHPVQRTNLTAKMEQSFFERGDDAQIIFQSPGDKQLFNRLNGGIFLHAPESISHLSHIDPKKIGKATVARKHLREILDTRDQDGDFGWTLCSFPTKELARHARLSMKAYTAQIINACFLDKKSPVSHWKHIYHHAASIKKWLTGMKVNFYHIESDHMDLIITPGEKRKWVGISGHNMPSFEIFLSPDWRGTNGIYFSNQPSFRNGNYVNGVKLEFRKGVVVDIEAQQGKNFVAKQLSMDIGANKVGEFSLTDKRFSRINTFMANTLFDENFGGKYGNCHLALGASYPDTYDGNPKELTKEKKKRLGFNDSALHWDLVNTEIYENGTFTI
ncbi:MAG: aminopeptidase, partial [Desulfobacterales bacterium]